MKVFEPDYIKNYIEEHKEEICCVLCGYFETFETLISPESVVFYNGNYVRELNEINKRIINSNKDSIERTPYMEVIFNDRTISFLYGFKFM